MSHAETSGGDVGNAGGAECQWGRGLAACGSDCMDPAAGYHTDGCSALASPACRATAEVESEAGAYCSLHAALRDAADERPVTWRELARAAAPIAVVVALFLLAPGCGS